jgi:hypothetical protein
MSRLPVPGSDVGDWGNILNDFLLQAHQADGILKDGSVNLNTIASNTVVDLSSDQTVGGIKNFTDSPIVPIPTTDTQAANKAYVDVNASTVTAGNTTGADPGTAIAIDSVMGSSGNTIANTDGAIAIGYDGTNAASATGSNSVAIGADSVANGNFVVAIGSTASATDDSTTAIGWGAEAQGEGSVALGGGTYSESGTQGAYADGYNALAVGSSSAQGDQSIALGSSSTNGYQTTSIGFNNTVQSDYSVAMGSGNSVYPSYSTAIGFSNYIDSSSIQCTALGYGSNIESSTNSLAINGYLYQTTNSTAINGQVNNSAGGAVAIGMDTTGNTANATNNNDFILGTSNHNVQVPGTLAVDSSVTLPTSVPGTPVDGQIWIGSDGLYFQAVGGTVYGPIT